MSPRPLLDALGGVTAVLVTPYVDGTKSVDKDKCAALAASLDDAGVHALTALGNTAEIHQLGPDERTAVLSGVSAGRTNAALLAGVGGPASDVFRAASSAAGLGYEAVMLHEPNDPYGDSAGLLAYYLHIVDRVPLPVVPYIRTDRLRTHDLPELAAHPNVVGVKYARGDLTALGTLLAEHGSVGSDAVWLNGRAESAVPEMAGIGVTGFTSGIANARPDAAIAVLTATRHGDLHALQQLLKFILPVERLRTANTNAHNVAVIKQMLRHQGFDAGGVRPPNAELSSATLNKLSRTLDQWPDDFSLTPQAANIEERMP